jgi:Subtilase family
MMGVPLLEACNSVHKRRPRLLLFVVITCALAQCCVAVPAYAGSPTSATKSSPKDPKICSLLRDLREQIPQQSHAFGQSPVRRLAFSVEELSKSVVDAVHGRQLRITRNGEVQVYIEIDRIAADYTRRLQTLGIKIEIQGDPQAHQVKGKVYAVVPMVQALVPIEMIQQLEDLPFVRYVRLPDYGISNTGSVDSQGDTILQAGIVRSATSGIDVDGTGVIVGVISTGIGGIFASDCTTCGPTTNNPSPITLGDLPSATGTRNSAGILISVSGGITATQSYRSDLDLEDTAGGSLGAEGTALLEIVHDLAPGATLYFTNADTGMDFEAAVNSLASTADVVVDDFSFFAAPYDGTSSVSTNTADAVNNNANPISAYVTSAGDYAQNHYAGAYDDSGLNGNSYTGESGDVHLFVGVPNDLTPLPGTTTDTQGFGPTTFDPIITIPPGAQVAIYLAWNDPFGASMNDYDLFLVPLSCGSPQDGLPTPPCAVSGPSITSSTNPQTGTQDPTETVMWTNTTGSNVTAGIVIENVANQAAIVMFDMFIVVSGYTVPGPTPSHNFNTISGSIPAEADAGGAPASVISVGAINQTQCAAPDNCTGLLEPYSSQGPTEATPQAASRIKPDITAVDNVCITGAGGFSNSNPASNCPPAQPTSYTPSLFEGTSAAAPHVAAIAALLLQTSPCLLYNSRVGTPAHARQSIYNTLTINTEPLPGYLESVPNSEVGYGLVDAFTSAKSMLPVPAALTVTPVSAVSSNGASVVLSPTDTDPNNCPIVAVQWSGDCGSGVANAPNATIACPIGVNTVRVGVSNNGLSFLPQEQVPYSKITVTDFVLSASPSSTSTSPGGPAIYTITVASTAQGVFGYPVVLNCSSGLPPGATCLFSPASVTLGTTGSATSLLTIYTALGSSASDTQRETTAGQVTYIGFAVPLFVAGFTFYRKGSRKTLTSHVFTFALLLLAVIEISSCGSRTSTTTSNTYSVTITGTANQLSHQTTVSLTE